MNNNFDEIKESFNKYIEDCKYKIRNTFFKDDYLLRYKSLKNSLIKSGKIDIDSSIEDAIKFERLEMIDIKFNHTMRVIEDVLRITEKLKTNIDFNNLLKISALLHDIGRFDQATWNNSFSDSCYKDNNSIKNHAHAGYHILFVNNKIKEFPIDTKFYPAIGSVVYNHGNSILTGYLNIKINDVKQLDVNKLTGLNNLNDIEKTIVATLVQMVRDVDMLDILYQHLTGEFPVIREYINYNIMNDNIELIASYWGISPDKILEYNKITSDELKKLDVIKIPVSEINLNKLSVPKDIQDRFFNNEDMDLKELIKRRDWNFIIGMWWRLNHFLNNINFTSNLEIISDKNLLEKIYNQYPDNYKFLVKDAFEFANNKLVLDVIKENKTKIYIK